MRNLSLFVVSWVLLLLLAGVITFFSVTSAMGAYGGAPDALTPAYGIEQLTQVSAEAATAVRARRVTAATWALAYGIMVLYVVLVPYRRGERWAWFALLLSLSISQLISLLRIVALGTMQGSGASIILLIILALGLAAGAPRMFAKAVAPAE